MPRSAYGGRVQGLQIAAREDREERRLRAAEDASIQNRIAREREEKRVGRQQALRSSEASRSRRLQERRVGLEEGRMAESDKRADRDLALQERRMGLTEAREKRYGTQQDSAAATAQQDAAMKRMADAYQLVDMGFEDQALEMLNESLPPGKRATSIAREGDTFLIGRGDEVDEIPLSQIRRYLPRDPAATAKKAPLTPGDKFAKTKADINAIKDFGKRWGIEEIKSDQRRTILEGIAADRPEEEIAKTAGVEESYQYGIDKKALQKTKDDIAKHEIALGKGDKRTWRGQSRDKLVKSLNELRGKQETALGIETEVAEPEEIVETPVEAPVEETAPQQGDIIEMYPEYDDNKDGKVDQLDSMYQIAKEVVMVMGEGANRQALVNRYGARKLADFEALVAAVEKKAREDAEMAVQGAR